MKEVQILDKKFREFITEQEIREKIQELALKINTDLKGREVLFIAVLNGAFMFAADLFKRIDLKAGITFIKLTSYSGTCSSGSVRELIGWNEELKGRSVVIVEDIVDTGETLEYTYNDIAGRNVSDIKVVTLLLKPAAYRKNIKLDYIGFEIPNDFVVGYGLDYDGFGRNLPSVYKIML
jgi:hypoxanthine phosphoribosyltransferase